MWLVVALALVLIASRTPREGYADWAPVRWRQQYEALKAKSKRRKARKLKARNTSIVLP